MKKHTIVDKLRSCKTRSAWSRGVILYAIDALDAIEIDDSVSIRDILNEAQNVREYSEGGCALIHNRDIAERLCSCSEYKRKRGGDLQPNSRESWLDVQTRALAQAFDIISKILRSN